MSARGAALVLAMALAGCSPAVAPISLDGGFPTTRADASYEAVTRGWTRDAILRADMQQVLELYATVRSPAWHAALANRDADRRHLDDAGRSKLLADAKAASDKALEVELMVSTWDRRENDLDRRNRSTWQVVLVGEDGTEIEPIEIKRDRRPPWSIRSDFPMFDDFAIGYVASFPADRGLLGPNVKQLRLRMFGPRGAVELTWKQPGT